MPAKKLNWFPRKRLVTAISFALTGGSFSAHSAPVYVITDLGVLNGVSSTGYGINSAGDVTGVIELPNEDTHAFVYSNGGMTDLGTLGGGTDSVGKDINDSGQVTGWSDTANGQHAFLYDGQMHDLDPLGDYEFGQGNGINNTGYVTGEVSIPDNGSRAFIYDGTQLQVIEATLGGTSSTGLSINNSEQMTGSSQLEGNYVQHAFIYSATEGMQDIRPELPGNSYGESINDRGQVAGYYQNGSGSSAFIYGNSFIDLGTKPLLVGKDSYAFGINESGQAVGGYRTTLIAYLAALSDVYLPPLTNAFLYTGGQAISLNDDSLCSGCGDWVLQRANAINDNGQITGEGYYSPQGQTHAFLATPTGTLEWIANSGNWSWDESENWELGFLPNRFLDVVIGNIYFPGPAPDVTITGPSGDSTVNSLTVGGGTSARVLDLSNGGNLTVINGVLVSGPNGGDRILQSTGTTTANSLTLGQNTGTSGTYSLSGNGSFTADNEIVGYAGDGVFNQSGGSNTVNDTLTLALESGSTGTYNLSGDGTLNALNEYIGHSGSGNFIQSGGTHTVNDNFIIGYNTGANGTYTQSAGSMTSSGSLEIGYFSGATGTYNLNGGSLHSQDVYVGEFGDGTFSQTGGTHTVAGNLTIALQDGSTGNYNQSGGTVTVGNALEIGSQPTAVGRYDLSGPAVLNVKDESVGVFGTGTFDQSGGTHNVTGTLTINSNSSYLLSGGELNAADLINQGTFTQSGGVSAGNFSNESTVNYSGGTFNANLTNTGTVNLSGTGIRALGGTISNQGGFSITDTVAQITGTFNNEDGGSLTGSEIRNEGTFNYSGGDYSVSALTNTGTINLSGTGTRVLGGTITNQGSFSITDTLAQITGTFNNETGGSLTGSQIQNDGTINYSAGSFDADLINNGTVNITGGGTRTLGGSVTNQGNIVVTDTVAQFAGSFNNIAGGSVSGTEIYNAGIFTYSGGNVSFSSLTNSGTYNWEVSDPVLNSTVTNQGQFNIADAVAQFNSTFNNVSGGNVSGGLVINSGTFNNSGNNFNANLTNTGMVNLSGSGTRVFNGDVTNQGTFNVTETNVAFNGNFDNQGVYVSDPSVNTFDNLNVGTDGYLVGGAGDQFIVRGNFTNSSTQNINWDTSQSTLIFDNANGPATHLMSLASADLGSALTAFDNNFAWGEVVLESGQRLTLVDANSTPGAALYASQLKLPNGVSQLNNISGDYNIYYDPALSSNQYLAGSVFNFGSGIGQLIPQGFSFLSTDPTAEGFTLNESSYAQALNTACPQATGALAQRCRELRVLTPTQRANAIASSTPTQQMAQTIAPIKFNFARMEAPMLRMAQLRRKQTQASTLSFNGFQMPINLSVAALGLNARGGGAGDDEPFADSFRDEPFGVFIDGKFTVGNQRDNPNNFGFDIDSRAVTVGADYRITDNLVAGAAMEYMNVNTTFDNSAGTMDSDTFMGAVYGSYRLPQDFYVDAIATYGSSEHALTRTFGYPGFSGNATSKPDADQYTFAITLGKDIAWQEWQISPYTRFEYLQMHVDSYQEGGGGGLAVNVGSQSETSAISTLGTQVSYNFSQSWGILVPTAWVEWEHQYLNDNESIPMRLSAAAAGTGSFVIQTGQPDRDYANLGGALSASLPGGKSAFIRYEARLGQTDISNNIVEVGVRIPF